jgi:hypothetical protein
MQLETMRQRIPLVVLTELTTIPTPVLSMYQNGNRPIARTHLSALAIALDVSPSHLLRQPCPADIVFVDEEELSELNPLPLLRQKRTTAAGY